MASLRLLTIIASLCLASVMAEWGAMPGPGLNPRYSLGEAAHLVNRQTFTCPAANEHTCLDVNAGSFCCPNTHYCIVANNTANCCFIGSTCSNPCDANHYECPSTTTVSGTAIATSSCCPRTCTSTSQYLCASSFGGQCCGYSSGCASNTQCVATATTTTSNPSTNTGTSSPSTSSSSPSSSIGLTTGAKAGIGAGVAVGALVVLGGFLWLCLGHRRHAKQKAASAPAMSQGSESGVGGGKRPSNGRSGSDYFGPTAAAGPFTEPNDSAATSPGANRGVPVSPQGPGDILLPVEIDSKSSRVHSNVTTPGAFEFTKPQSPTVEPVELP